jgi:Domain of unknown function (DUF4386)
MEEKNSARIKTTRIPGILYVIMGIAAAFGIMYVLPKIMVQGNAAATATNILLNEFLFRTGIVSQFISNTMFILLVFVLYQLFKQVSRYHAKLMVAFVLVQVPIGFLMETFNITSLLILKGEIMKALDSEHRQDMATLFLTMHKYGMITVELFSGLWLIPFGQLVYKTRFISRILGVLLIIGGVAYIIESLTYWLFPDYQPFVSRFAIILYSIGETPIILWLLIKGLRIPEIRHSN